MSQLVCYGEGQRQTRVLVDAAAAMRLTHSRHMREPKRLTGLVSGRTNVFPVPKRSVTHAYIKHRNLSQNSSSLLAIFHSLNTEELGSLFVPLIAVQSKCNNLQAEIAQNFPERQKIIYNETYNRHQYHRISDDTSETMFLVTFTKKKSFYSATIAA